MTNQSERRAKEVPRLLPWLAVSSSPSASLPPPPPLSHSSARHTSVGSTPLARLRAPAAITLAFALALAAVAD